ncbi:unnamed protein product [Miscanthus lutarioriparius]|uniref:Uncharacterized protein n=1 Tax=Miscanthus lutarioriparius TaxID=422564 RepID=A0A811NW98_9POAL|nr:unnamed protein product [Miscanthus lutarioriparius]
MARGLRQQQHASSSNQGTRNVQGTRKRASPSRLVKLYKKMIESQRNRIKAIGFGGLLNIKCDTLLAWLANWLMVDCFDAESLQLVLPGRGVIKVIDEAMQSIMDLPNNGDEVKCELDVNAIDFIQAKYKIARGKAPRIGAILKSSAHTVVQSSLFQLDDVHIFVSSKVSSNMSDEKRRKLTTAKKVSKIKEPSSTTSSHGDGAASECQPPRVEQRHTRSMQIRQAPKDDQLPDEEDEDDGTNDDKDESDDDEEDDEEDDGTDDEEDDGGDDEEETVGEYSSSEDTKEESDPLEDGGTPPPDFDDLVDGMFTDNISEDEHSSQDHVPLIAWLRRMRKGTEAKNQDKGSDKHSSLPMSADGKSTIHSSPERAKDDERPAEPQPLAYILPENLKKVGITHNKKSKLRLPSNPVEQKDAGDGAATATSVHNVGEGCSFKVLGSENIV